MATEIIKDNRLSDAHTMTLTDILRNDLLQQEQKQYSCDVIPSHNRIIKLDIYADKSEMMFSHTFNLSINGNKAGLYAQRFYLTLVSGKDNETGAPAAYITPSAIDDDGENTLVNFTFTIDGNPSGFSTHKDGLSVSKYCLHAVLGQAPDGTTDHSLYDHPYPGEQSLLFATGSVYLSDILFDNVENIDSKSAIGA